MLFVTCAEPPFEELQVRAASQSRQVLPALPAVCGIVSTKCRGELVFCPDSTVCSAVLFLSLQTGHPCRRHGCHSHSTVVRQQGRHTAQQSSPALSRITVRRYRQAPPRGPPPGVPPNGGGGGMDNFTKALIAGAFIMGMGTGVWFNSEASVHPSNVASTEIIDRQTPNSEVCMANGYSSMVFDQRIFVSFNPCAPVPVRAGREPFGKASGCLSMACDSRG